MWQAAGQLLNVFGLRYTAASEGAVRDGVNFKIMLLLIFYFTQDAFGI